MYLITYWLSGCALARAMTFWDLEKRFFMAGEILVIFVWLINLIDFFRMIDRFCGSSLKMFFWDIKFCEISVYRTVLWREGNLDFYDIKYKIMGWFLQNVLANSSSDFQDTFKSLSINNPFLTWKNSNFLQYFHKRMEIPYKKSITTS